MPINPSKVKDITGYVRVYVQTSPGHRFAFLLPHRPTLGAVLADLPEERRGYLVAIEKRPGTLLISVNDEPVETSLDVPISPGDRVVIQVVPGVIAATALAAGLGTLGAGGFIAGSFVLANAAIIGSIISVGLSVGLGLLSSLVFAPKIEDLSGASSGSESLRITGSRNRIRAGQPVSAPYGRNRYTPPLAFKPQSRLNSDTGNQDIRQAFLIGLGKYRLTDFRIGQTPFAEFAGSFLEDVVTQGGSPLVEEGGITGQLPSLTSHLPDGSNSLLNVAVEGEQLTPAASRVAAASLWFKPTASDVSNSRSFFNLVNESASFGSWLTDDRIRGAEGITLDKTGSEIILTVWGIAPGPGGFNPNLLDFSTPLWETRYPASILTANQWTNITISLDADVARAGNVSAGLKLYLNGQLQTSTSAVTKPDAEFGDFNGMTQHRVFLGGTPDQIQLPTFQVTPFIIQSMKGELSGPIFQFGIWSATVSDDQAAAIWNGGNGQLLDLSVDESEEQAPGIRYQLGEQLTRYYRSEKHGELPEQITVFLPDDFW